MAAEPTPRPWRISPVWEEDRFWIDGPEGSAASERLPKDRRVVCEFPLYGDEKLDAESWANARLIVQAANAAGRDSDDAT